MSKDNPVMAETPMTQDPKRDSSTKIVWLRNSTRHMLTVTGSDGEKYFFHPKQIHHLPPGVTASQLPEGIKEATAPK